MSREFIANLEIKLLIIVGCFFNLIQNHFLVKDTVLVLLAILLSLFLEYRRTFASRVLVIGLVVIISSVNLKFTLLTPILILDYFEIDELWTYLLYPSLSFLVIFSLYNQERLILLNHTFIILVAIILNRKIRTFLQLKSDYDALEDSSQKEQFILERQKNVLITEQDLNLRLGISNERTRIARDIHDNVGHLLSSALIQLGAINVLNQDSKLTEPLRLVSETVEEGMNNIRQSVHELHDDSLNLKSSVKHIIDNIQGKSVNFHYELTSVIDNQLKVDLLMVIRESLANSLKHSTSQIVELELIEQPGFYRLLITDQGKNKKEYNPLNDGIGILSMKKRIAQHGGRLTVEQTGEAFQVLAIIPKEQGGF